MPPYNRCKQIPPVQQNANYFQCLRHEYGAGILYGVLVCAGIAPVMWLGSNE